jgi:transcriptional regulator with XRE-family HTH domain
MTHTTRRKPMAPKSAKPRSKPVSSSASRVRAKKSAAPSQLERKLREAVKAHGNNSELASQAGLTADMLSRFTREERTLRLPSAGKLAAALGLVLVETE